VVYEATSPNCRYVPLKKRGIAIGSGGWGSTVQMSERENNWEIWTALIDVRSIVILALRAT
jgi:hypothetical protein